MRKLASIQKIVDLQPIPNADRIEVATVLGWKVVVKKGEFEVGDLCVYFEIDSVLKPEPWNEFMKDRKYRVKTIKLRKQISQGLAVPLDTFKFAPRYIPFEFVDLTDKLGVKKHDPVAAREANVSGNIKRVIPHKWLLRWSLGRRIHQKLYPRASGSWPGWFPKTDETRVQNLPNIGEMVKGRSLYNTEKLDGQSATFFYHRTQKIGLLSRGLYGVCSKNIWYKNYQPNNWCNMSKSLDMEERLSNYCNENKVSLAIQGEIIGPGIQKNRYNREEHELYVFGVFDIDKERYLNFTEKFEVISILGLCSVPQLTKGTEYPSSATPDDFLYLAENFTALCPEDDIQREGIVFRDINDDHFSFKAVSNKFLLEGGE